jgi:hypothetical protein
MSNVNEKQVISRDLRNAELDDIIGDIKFGNLVIIDKIKTSNPLYTNLYLYGPVEGIRSESSGVSKAQARLLGWDNSSNNMRCIANASTEIVDELNIGDAIQGCIRVTDYLEPQFDNHNPRTDSNGNILYHNGNEVFRYTELVDEEELMESGHNILKASANKVVREVPTGEPPKGASVNKLTKVPF